MMLGVVCDGLFNALQKVIECCPMELTSSLFLNMFTCPVTTTILIRQWMLHFWMASHDASSLTCHFVVWQPGAPRCGHWLRLVFVWCPNCIETCRSMWGASWASVDSLRLTCSTFLQMTPRKSSMLPRGAASWQTRRFSTFRASVWQEFFWPSARRKISIPGSLGPRGWVSSASKKTFRCSAGKAWMRSCQRGAFGRRQPEFLFAMARNWTSSSRIQCQVKRHWPCRSVSVLNSPHALKQTLQWSS